MKPICSQCRRFYKPTKNGIYFIEQMPTKNGAKPGLEEPENWKPYKLWQGDEWTCLGCSAVIIVGCGREPISEHYKEGFSKWTATMGPETLRINDC